MRIGGGGGRGSGRGVGQSGSGSAGRGKETLDLVSLGFGLISDLVGRRRAARNEGADQVPGNGGLFRWRASDKSTMSRFIAAVLMDGCSFCGVCQQACAYGAITLGQILRIDATKCTGCGDCVVECPEEVLVLKKR